MRYGSHARWGPDEKDSIERLCFSPYVEEPLNSKVIKGSYLNWEVITCFLYFKILCSMWDVLCIYVLMYISYIAVSGYGTLGVLFGHLCTWSRDFCSHVIKEFILFTFRDLIWATLRSSGISGGFFVVSWKQTMTANGLQSSSSTGLSPPAITVNSPTRLPLVSFTFSWTLSPTFFSTFPHGTSWLSDSSWYLALDGAYHPIWAAFTSNPTLGSKAVTRRLHRMNLAPTAGNPDQGNSELCESKTNGCLQPMCHTSRSLLLVMGFGVGLLPVIILSKRMGISQNRCSTVQWMWCLIFLASIWRHPAFSKTPVSDFQLVFSRHLWHFWLKCSSNFIYQFYNIQLSKVYKKVERIQSSWLFCFMDSCTSLLWYSKSLQYTKSVCYQLCSIYQDELKNGFLNGSNNPSWWYPYLPTPPLRQDMTQGQFLSRI